MENRVGNGFAEPAPELNRSLSTVGQRPKIALKKTSLNPFHASPPQKS